MPRLFLKLHTTAGTIILGVTTEDPGTPPAAPSGLSAAATGPTSIHLTWTDNATDEDNFVLERSADGSTGWAQVATPAANATSADDTGLTAATQYFYRLKAVNAAGSSSYSSTANATTTVNPPAAPSGLNATATGSSSIGLTWTDNSSNEANFVLERSPHGAGTWTQIATPAANATSATSSGLTASTQYDYRIKAVNAGGSSSYSNTATATTDAGGSPGSAFAVVGARNHSGSSSVAPEVRFGHAFKQGDVPSGSKLAITLDDTTPVPYTAAARNAWPDGSLRFADLYLKLPSTIAGSGTANLNLAATTGSFDDALPGGKTVANIVADITTNFDTIRLEVSDLVNSAGSTVGSGTYVADSTTAFGMGATPTSHGHYRCTDTGPTAANFTVQMKLKDNTGGAETAGSLWAQWYITAFLNPSTGAVTKLSWRAWLNQGMRTIAQDKYRYRGKLKLGSTVVRSWGFASDNRAQSFAPSAVNTGTDRITLTGHGFVTGDLVRLTTTGTLPGGLSTATDYWVYRVDADTISLDVSLQFAILSGAIDLSSQGSGTHTITGYVHHCMYQKQCWADRDGLWDWHQGTSGALGGEPTIHVVHDNTYYRASKMAPPLDLSITFADPAEANPSLYAPGTFGRMNPLIGSAGANISYGAPWNEWTARRYHSPDDRTGYVQTARVHALCLGMVSQWHFRDDTTWRIAVHNNGHANSGTAYTGLGACLPDSYSFDGAGSSARSVDYVTPTSQDTDSFTGMDYSHHYSGIQGVYLFEGGRDLLDMVYGDAAFSMTCRYGASSSSFDGTSNANMVLTRKMNTGSAVYFSSMPGIETRSDAWRLNVLVHAVVAGADADPETAYLKDVLDDTLTTVAWFINTLGDASWRALGGWDIAENQITGPGLRYAGNSEMSTMFMQAYIGMSWCFGCMRYPTANMQTAAAHVAKLFENFWINATCKAFGSTYNFKVKEAAGTSTSPDAALHSALANVGIEDINLAAIVWAADGTATQLPLSGGGPAIPLQQGDRLFLTTSWNRSADYYASVPPEYTRFTWYYARQVTGTTCKMATTNSDGTIVGSVTPDITTRTLTAGIDASTTTIPISSAVTIGGTFQVIKVDSEYMALWGGNGTSSLSVFRGMYGSTAASHSNGATVHVPHTGFYFVDAQNRASGCPTVPVGHNGLAEVVQFGYVTMPTAACAYAYLAGVLDIAAHTAAYAYFSQGTNFGYGPGGFAQLDSVMHSAVTTI